MVTFHSQFVWRQRYQRHVKIVGTSFESRAALVTNDFAGENIEKLSSFESVEIMHEVDATDLCQKFGSRTFDRVIFNFPLTGGKSNIAKSRDLVSGSLQAPRTTWNSSKAISVLKPLSVSGRNALRQSKKGAWKLLAGCLPSCESWLVFVCLSFF